LKSKSWSLSLNVNHSDSSMICLVKINDMWWWISEDCSCCRGGPMRRASFVVREEWSLQERQHYNAQVGVWKRWFVCKSWVNESVPSVMQSHVYIVVEGVNHLQVLRREFWRPLEITRTVRVNLWWRAHGLTCTFTVLLHNEEGLCYVGPLCWACHIGLFLGPE